nr:MAG TPA: hypothetical protein [Caudoviricetes sp.]
MFETSGLEDRGPISESEMVLRSSPPGYYHADIAMRSIF